MKKIGIILFLIVSIISISNAQSLKFSENSRTCDFGITFEISNNPNWGYGEPVVTSVQPFSFADRSGIKIGDVIMEINGTATYLRNHQTIQSWLQDAKNPEVRLTIRNVNTYFKEYTIYRQCKNANSLNEFALASSFSFYSMEDTNQRGFAMPLRVDPNLSVDFSDYHTFDFANEGTDIPDVDHRINAEIEKALLSIGLTKNTKDPDFIVQSYYTFQPNIKQDPSNRGRDLRTWRYDSQAKKMIQVPILSADDPNAEYKGQYVLELGIRFFDKKYIDENKLTQIWDCRSREFLTQQLDLPEYARIHAPLMVMQFPYSAPKTIARFVAEFQSFNYTGLNFDAADLKTITNVDHNSPAYQAGIRGTDVIEKINGIKMGYSADELDNGYRRFIIETMPLRDKSTRFIDANGFPDCMYWDKSKYADVAAAFQKEGLYYPSFSYLYAFRNYVSGTSSPTIFVEYKTASGEKKSASIVPQLQQSAVIRNR